MDTKMTGINPKVDFYFQKAEKWKAEYLELRRIVLDCQLNEDLKWGHPCYSLNKKNVVLIHGFKEYCALLFMKGALLHDDHGLLVQQTENVQAARQIRFTNVREIVENEDVLKSYILEAIEVERSGLEVVMKKASEFSVVDEFVSRLEDVPGLQEAFDALTPGRQRAYLLFFSTPKQSKTREARIEKSIPHILNGRGLND